ncbi:MULTISPECIES: DegV family protein [Clostridium]|uniref:DegV family protein, putative n=1 Tax=Clostridium novyi (strain NT) TaxID=386415 RepID=A0PX98_CLONN|nr:MULTISPECIES: DegV family protein [Clostridium]ABK62206.1 DegV family protein, putative [Clostridium novyi NT]KEH86899.1 fatty acid-binding protein DegV [Clostridium novyi A str. NCTC 538]KEH89792.1 fatty acid-binding protein DegV [Clostridium novyi A str. BKT29909]KEH89964.1 fatty acid-binding protein DegV [Clostridium novyi A str. 4540]KEH95217.1 fatty acid-binding protein DegV [Clostridium botulinum C/D str. It1]
MDIKIVADSSCDLSQELKEEMNIDIAPLTLILEGKEYIDNEELNVSEYIENMANCKTSPKTACPSPQDYIEKYKGEESVFVVPLSSKLSGSYNSAVLAKNLFLDEIGNKFIHVFDSVTASVGQTIISLKINELSKLNLGELEIVEKVNKYISEMKTFFLLESLDHLAKAGRLNPIIAKVANMLSIKPIMGSNDDGTIRMVEKTRGYKKAFKRFIDIIGEEGSNLEQKVLGIAHCNCLERALQFKEEVLKRYNFKDIVVVEMSGLSTTYADNGGLVIAF